MSGGHFDYKQYQIQEIRDSIERELNNQGKDKPKSELWSDEEYYTKYPEEMKYLTYRTDIEEKFKEAIKILKRAEIYVQRIDWYLSGDDGEDSFIERLEEELKEISK
ncbi:MAG: hypothetical protein M0R17_04920 [Candidatus Omnitrophica bacterium]|jgi:hypothetical protein|nr:hypothetical protein [Candidatus Omnitrophota bacterium]